MKRSLLVELLAAAFIILFVYTASSKLFEFSHFRYVLSTSPMIGKRAVWLAWALPAAELIIALLLFFPRSRRAGLWASLIIMLVFTGYLSYMIYFTPDHPCNCGGVLKQMTWKQHLVFNIFFTLLALTGLWLSRKRSIAENNETTESAVFT